jgi:hypothetical protein
MTAPLIGVLGVSHIDFVCAEQWLGWRKQLVKQGNIPGGRLVVAMTQRLSPQQRDLLVSASGGGDDITWYVLPTENEAGYPRSGCHLFVSALDFCNVTFPGSPVLWIEADAIPMRSGWFQAIALEYGGCGKPFMGVIERNAGDFHMAGVAVYPANWRELAPKLAESVNATDVAQFGPTHGQAFDVYAKDQTTPLCAEAKTIQQFWRPQHPIREPWAKEFIKPETALFHQCKDGSLIAVLRGFPNGYAPGGATSPQTVGQPLRGVIFTSRKVGGHGS